MKSLAMCIIIGILVLSVFGQTSQTGSPSLSDAPLDRTVNGIDLEYSTTPDAFYASLGRTKVAGGMVKVVNCEGDTFKQIWNPFGRPLRQVLDGIVAADPRYRWELNEGVVNLLLAKGDPALLGIHIKEFHVEKATEASEALGYLLALPEVKKGMANLNLKHGLNIFVSPRSPHPKEFSVDCKGITLREALNAIAKAQGRAVWDYIEMHCDGKN